MTTIAALATRMLSSRRWRFSVPSLGACERWRTCTICFRAVTGQCWTALIEAALGSQIGRDNPAISLDGADVMLGPTTASTLGLVFYELATNAIKYGSLSGSGGRVEVSWRSESSDGGRLVLNWIEGGGPTLPGPLKEGFGTAFVKRTVEYELRGIADVQIAAEGLRWNIAFPLDGNVQARVD